MRRDIFFFFFFPFSLYSFCAWCCSHPPPARLLLNPLRTNTSLADLRHGRQFFSHPGPKGFANSAFMFDNDWGFGFFFGFRLLYFNSYYRQKERMRKAAEGNAFQPKHGAAVSTASPAAPPRSRSFPAEHPQSGTFPYVRPTRFGTKAPQ